MARRSVRATPLCVDMPIKKKARMRGPIEGFSDRDGGQADLP
jgi:hypothetical protein